MMRPQPTTAHLVLADIRTQYLQARAPQQITELRNLFAKITESQKGEIIAVIASTEDQEVNGSDGCAVAVEVDLSSIRNKCAATTTCYTGSGEENETTVKKVLGGMKEDLDGVGTETGDEKLCVNTVPNTPSSNSNAALVEDSETSTFTTDNKGKCAGSSIIVSDAEIQANVQRDLYDITIGYRPAYRLATTEGKGEGDDQEHHFFHPPLRYRVGFAKYIIKQLESSRNWSAPQGSNEEDVEDPVEQETLLEKWYDGLESLSNNSSQQMLSEPFYRLYEIKVAHHNHNGSSSRVNANIPSSGANRQGIVKIFEHETSFVADGTTGLVTWKASIEFLRWLTSPWEDEGKLLLEKFGEESEIKWALELGCGCGFLAIGLAKSIPTKLQQYIATDGSLAALEKAKLNVEANFSKKDNHEKLIMDRMRYEKVEWQNDATKESFSQLVDGMTSIFGADKGLLLGADIVFDPGLIPDLVTLICEFIEAKAGKAILACTIRNETTMDCLKKQLNSNNLVTRICGKWDDGEILEICSS